ncbi:hypothetical protein [Mucilaginibacter celer]|uniref:Lipoprotein n=1 Tax=Mucilaginibacter celer TaxID=2305508 RepID=A0A494VPE5_9SPHI|nr:hypothetical protein [Mucilaginibacter celer]AYL96139.1 hypothetical protein HYN43_012930 [Mucilaginibacter celer]
MNLKNLTIAAAVLATMSFYACTQKPQGAATTPAPSIVLDPDTISVDSAMKYVANFSRNTHDSIPGEGVLGKKRPNTRCIWFSIDRLDSLVKKIKAEKGDGIRFYMAAYDNHYNPKGLNTPPKDYWGHSTLIMVSTYLDQASGNHNDYYKGSPFSNGGSGGIFTTTPENRGELCPPPATCKSIGATLFDK